MKIKLVIFFKNVCGSKTYLVSLSDILVTCFKIYVNEGKGTKFSCPYGANNVQIS